MRVQVKLFTELFTNLFNSVIFAVLRADTRESLAEAQKQFDNNLKVLFNGLQSIQPCSSIFDCPAPLFQDVCDWE